MQRDRKAHRVRKGLEVALGDQAIDQRLLLGSVFGHACCGLGDPKPFQRGPRPIQPPLPSHVRLVERRREASGVGEAGERLPPSSLVRRGNQHAIHVENRRQQLDPATGWFWRLRRVVSHPLRASFGNYVQGRMLALRGCRPRSSQHAQSWPSALASSPASDMSSPYRAMSSLCSMSLLRIACFAYESKQSRQRPSESGRCRINVAHGTKLAAAPYVWIKNRCFSDKLLDMITFPPWHVHALLLH